MPPMRGALQRERDISMVKAKANADPFAHMQTYKRKGRNYQARNNCRISLRKMKLLVILLTKEIMTEAGFAFGDHVELQFDDRSLGIVPAEAGNGAFCVRRQESGSSVYPMLLVPIGGDNFNITFDRPGSTVCPHVIDQGRLLLSLPESVRLTPNGSAEEC
jgi:hypothetical protein